MKQYLTIFALLILASNLHAQDSTGFYHQKAASIISRIYGAEDTSGIVVSHESNFWYAHSSLPDSWNNHVYFFGTHVFVVQSAHTTDMLEGGLLYYFPLSEADSIGKIDYANGLRESSEQGKVTFFQPGQFSISWEKKDDDLAKAEIRILSCSQVTAGKKN